MCAKLVSRATAGEAAPATMHRTCASSGHTPKAEIASACVHSPRASFMALMEVRRRILCKVRQRKV